LKTVTNLNDPNLVRALAHPLRARILGALQEKRASPTELADQLRAPLGTVSYHVRTLADLKLIKLVKETPRRGAVEHHYEAVSMAHITDQAWGESPAVIKNAMVAAALGEVGRSVTEAAAMGGFDSEDAHLTRTRLTLDREGWEELAGKMLELLGDVDRIQAESAKRLKAGNHEGERHADAVMMLFDTLAAPDVPPPAATKKKGAVRTPAAGGRSRARSS
jgi:DNA-binding transcriptional ArsR family regulator